MRIYDSLWVISPFIFIVIAVLMTLVAHIYIDGTIIPICLGDEEALSLISKFYQRWVGLLPPSLSAYYFYLSAPLRPFQYSYANKFHIVSC